MLVERKGLTAPESVGLAGGESTLVLGGGVRIFPMKEGLCVEPHDRVISLNRNLVQKRGHGPILILILILILK